MKKIMVSLLLAICMVLGSTVSSFADENNNNRLQSTEHISKEETLLYTNAVENILLNNDFQIAILFDYEGSPSYILCTNENGYVVLKRYTSIICECGEINPYRDNMDIKKYYGGALSYYLDGEEYAKKTGMRIEAQFIDIVGQVATDKINVVLFNKTEESEENEIPTRLEIGIVSNSYNYIRRKAFGYNNDSTCSAVACAIALNYIKHKYGINVISSSQTAENYDNGRAPSASYVATYYPKAHSLHRSLVDDYGMGAVSYAEGIVVPLSSYLEDMIPNSAQRPTISWTYFPSYSTIKTNILQSKPVLITTTIAGDYSWHTMVVYGYKIDNDNDLLLVHTGWYSSQYNSPVSSGSNSYYQNQVWINKSYATYGYYFTIPNN